MSDVNNHYVLSDGDKEFQAELSRALENAIEILKRTMKRFESGCEYPLRHIDGEYIKIANGDIRGTCWTEGFFPGQLWLGYDVTGDRTFRELGEKNLEDFYRRVEENNNIDWHHDLGFLYSLSSVAPYKLTGNELGKKAALMAAYSLARRFRYKGEFIQSMSAEFDEINYRFIVDTMMNLPLLFWASEETGDESYKDKAVRHIRTTLRYILREDGSTYHHFLMNNKTGEPVRGLTLQGASDESFWSRGHSWIIYGLALAYGYTKDDSYLEPFCRATDFFIDRLPSDYIPMWDLIYTENDDEPRDSSAAAIAVCGIMEMARLIPHDTCNMEKYIDAAKKIMRSMISKTYSNSPDTNTEGLLLHVMPGKPQGMLNKCAPYGDYFYLESLVRATKDWKCFW